MTLLQQFYGWLVTSNQWWDWVAFIVVALSGIVAIILFVLLFVILFIFTERRVLARFQIRLGPNRVGPEGLFQAFADAIKVLTKEDIVPRAADKIVHWMAPVVTFIPVIMVFAVIPIHQGAVFADLNIGVLYLVAVGSFSVLGMFMAGWASNNKYSLIAGLRAVSQMIAYEMPAIFSILAVVVAAGTLSLGGIVEGQSIPLILLQPLGFLIYFLASSAEINRAPFDMLEADSELVAGIHTEYSGMKFAMFYLGEYGHALGSAAIITSLFLSGWQGPALPPIIWFLIKIFAVFFLMIWVRATMPRIRVDQLSSFGWKYLLPLSVINLIIVAIEKVLWLDTHPWLVISINLVFSALLLYGWSHAVSVRGGSVET
jgi:NADH-quinone oxidoreductase subunit H